MTTTLSVATHDHKNSVNEATTAKQQHHITPNGLKSSKKLTQRESSGFIGCYTCNVQFTDIEMLQLLDVLKLDHFHKSTVEVALLKHLNVALDNVRVKKPVVAVADKTPVATTEQLDAQLLDAIREARTRNVSFDDIRAKLSHAGFTEQKINAHFESVTVARPVEPVIPKLF